MKSLKDMKRRDILAIAALAIGITAVCVFAQEFRDVVIFYNDVLFDTGSNVKLNGTWRIAGTKVTATASELNGVGADQTALITETNRAQVAEAVLTTNKVTLSVGQTNFYTIATGNVAITNQMSTMPGVWLTNTTIAADGKTNTYVFRPAGAIYVLKSITTTP